MPKLFGISKSEYKPLTCPEYALEKYKSLSSYSLETTVFGGAVTTVVIYNPKLKKGQIQGININIEKKLNFWEFREICLDDTGVKSKRARSLRVKASQKRLIKY